MSILTNLENDVEHFVQQAMQTWNTSGLALVIDKDDQVVLSKGYGVREMNRPDLAPMLFAERCRDLGE